MSISPTIDVAKVKSKSAVDSAATYLDSPRLVGLLKFSGVEFGLCGGAWVLDRGGGPCGGSRRLGTAGGEIAAPALG